MADNPFTDEKVSCTGEASGFLREKLSSTQFEYEAGRMQIREPYLYNLFRNYYSKLDVETSGEAAVHWDNINSTPTTLAGYGITDALASPLTTKGDIWTYSTVNTRLGIGTDTHVLKAASGQATGLAWGTVNWSELTGSQPAPVAHVLATSGPHTGTLPFTDLAEGSRGSLIRRGATDWEEYALGTSTYVLKAGVTDIAWGQVAWGEVTGKPTVVDMTDGADNRVCTAVDANTIKGEQNLTFSGSKLTVVGSIIINGDDGGIAGTVGLVKTTANIGTAAVSGLSAHETDSPVASNTVAKWWKIFIGTSIYYIPLFQ